MSSSPAPEPGKLVSKLRDIYLNTSPFIYKVPRKIRSENSKPYETEYVSIGPYSHGDPLFRGAEELKLRYFNSLLRRITHLKLQHYIKAMENIDLEARYCYEVPYVNVDETKFLEMLVMDGCFIIEVINSLKVLDTCFPVRSNKRILQRDLLLFENQIPFFVLYKLFNLIEGQGQTLLMERVLGFFQDVNHEYFLGQIPGTMGRIKVEVKHVKHILDLIYHHWFPPSSYPKITTLTSTLSPRRIPCASQLKYANVKFANKEVNFGTSLFDVEFTDRGELVMPPLQIDDWTESCLKNFIVYEQFFPRGKPTPITDYAFLLDSLIDTSEDVQILTQAKIIQNMLGSDIAVVSFVNKLTDKVKLYEDSFMHIDIFKRINSHCEMPWNRRVASLHRDYFNSPWAVFAFLGALLLLLLAVAQTTLTAIQCSNMLVHTIDHKLGFYLISFVSAMCVFMN